MKRSEAIKDIEFIVSLCYNFNLNSRETAIVLLDLLEEIGLEPPMTKAMTVFGEKYLNKWDEE